MSSFAQKHPEAFQFLKFTFASGSSTIVEFIVFYILQFTVFRSLNTEPISFWIFQYEGLGYFWAFLISTTVGYIMAFLLNRKYTFHANANPVLSVVLYILMVLFTLVFTTWLGGELMNWFIAIGRRDWGEWVAKPLVTLLAFTWTYPLNRFVIQRKKPEAGKEL